MDDSVHAKSYCWKEKISKNLDICIKNTYYLIMLINYVNLMRGKGEIDAD